MFRQDWAIFVQDRDFWERLGKLEKDIAYKEGRKRGWFSYTELSCLMENVQLVALVHAFVSVSSICLATYAAGLMTLLGSVLVASQLPGTSLAPRQAIQPRDVRAPNFTRPQQMSPGSSRIGDLESPLEDTQISQDFDISLLNDSCPNCDIQQSKKQNSSEEYASWEWWLNSMMTWLPEHAKINDRNIIYGLDNEKEKWRVESVGKFLPHGESLGAFITNGQLIGKDGYMREAENLMMEINWKETLSSDFTVPSNDWQYYANKISLGHGH